MHSWLICTAKIALFQCTSQYCSLHSLTSDTGIWVKIFNMILTTATSARWLQWQSLRSHKFGGFTRQTHWTATSTSLNEILLDVSTPCILELAACLGPRVSVNISSWKRSKLLSELLEWLISWHPPFHFYWRREEASMSYPWDEGIYERSAGWKNPHSALMDCKKDNITQYYIISPNIPKITYILIMQSKRKSSSSRVVTLSMGRTFW